ncbi:MAG TPA: GNAT family N-acetyltransferase [Tepidisphaeraceae bacterium]|jgi:phosphinothricin acetyltransferase|nr:GNAT family N-acetyltransferase [Tepidisphaeraceae bacterium]
MHHPQIRLAAEADLLAINDIYNHYVLSSTCTYQLDPEKIEDRQKWFANHGEKHPITVAEIDDKLVGWGSLSKFHQRAAYSKTVENSVYVHPNHQRQKIGSTLLADLIERAKNAGHHTILACIDADQAGSVALHDRFRFTKVGHMKQLGFKFNRWLDVVYMQLML